MFDLRPSFRQSSFDFDSQKHQDDNCAPARATPLEELSFCSSLNALQGDIQCDRDVIPPDNIDEILVSKLFFINFNSTNCSNNIFVLNFSSKKLILVILEIVPLIRDFVTLWDLFKMSFNAIEM